MTVVMLCFQKAQRRVLWCWSLPVVVAAVAVVVGCCASRTATRVHCTLHSGNKTLPSSFFFFSFSFSFFSFEWTIHELIGFLRYMRNRLKYWLLGCYLASSLTFLEEFKNIYLNLPSFNFFFSFWFCCFRNLRLSIIHHPWHYTPLSVTFQKILSHTFQSTHLLLL